MPRPVAIDDAALAQVAGGNLIAANHGVRNLQGSAGDDLLTGATGADQLSGNAGDDVLDGRDGNDLLEGGEGQDTVLGGAGDDTVIWLPGDGNDSIDGGAGTDTLLLPSSELSDIAVTLADGTVLQPVDLGGGMGFALPPGAAGTVTIGGERISFTGLERILVGEMPEFQAGTRQG